MSLKFFILTCFLLISASIYFFVTAPVPLQEFNTQETIPFERALTTWAQENDVVRQLWTSEIVGKGKSSGLKFDENWRLDGVDAGPLPALFLRQMAKELEKSPQPISLYLGSDFPINQANLLTGTQSTYFEKLKHNPEPQFFFSPETQRYTAIFADRASAQACVDCHNQHPESPKQNWQANDIMGATTWAYPKDKLTNRELLDGIRALRSAMEKTYQSYLEKSQSFPVPPEIGDKWPAEGNFLPSAEVFMSEFHRRTSNLTLKRLLEDQS